MNKFTQNLLKMISGAADIPADEGRGLYIMSTFVFSSQSQSVLPIICLLYWLYTNVCQCNSYFNTNSSSESVGPPNEQNGMLYICCKSPSLPEFCWSGNNHSAA